MFRQKTPELYRLVESYARLDRAQPVLFTAVQHASQGGAPSSGSAAADAGPQTDSFTEKLQSKVSRELESLTSKAQDDDDDWVDVSPAC